MNENCTCQRKGMTYFELRAMGSGCTKGYVCPKLDLARRTVRQPTAEERAADDLALAKELGIGRGVGL